MNSESDETSHVTPPASFTARKSDMTRSSPEILDRAGDGQLAQEEGISPKTPENRYRDIGSSPEAVSTSTSLRDCQGRGEPEYSLHQAGAALVTPPLSSKGKQVPENHGLGESTDWAQKGRVAKTSSFGSKRRVKPASLDIDALRRERQFTGPYSSNPLLSRERMPEELRNETPTNEPDLRVPVQELRVRNPEASSGPFCSPQPTDSPSKKVRLPQILSGPLAAITSYPLSAHARVPMSSSALPSHLFPDSLAASPTERARASSHPIDVSRNMPSHEKLTGSPNATETASTKGPVSENVRDKRAKFLELCSEIWDLIKED